MESSSSCSSKRPRASANTKQVPPCVVDGCTADLSKCRDYHRRHKVCESHSKTPTVTIRGQEQRFCQQCSRFHSLVEFDEGKRSCRKRLDGHNRRRRKPQPDSLSISSGRFLPSHQGVTFLPLSRPQLFPSTTLTSAWTGAIKTETELHSELMFGIRSNLFPGQQKRFPFLQTTASSSGPTVSGLGASSSSGNDGSRKMFDVNRALSLLSSQSAEARDIGLSHMVQCDQQQSSIPNLCYSNGVGIEGGQEGSLLSFDGSSSSSSNNFYGHGPDLLRVGHPGYLNGGAHHSLSFSWE